MGSIPHGQLGENAVCHAGEGNRTGHVSVWEWIMVAALVMEHQHKPEDATKMNAQVDVAGMSYVSHFPEIFHYYLMIYNT